MGRQRRGVLPGFHLTLGITLFVLGVMVLLPLCAIAVEASSLGWREFLRVGFDARALAAYRVTFSTAAAAAATNAVFGVLLAWVLVRYRFPGRRIADALVDLPFALPTAVAGIALTALYHADGWLGSPLAAAGIKVAFTPLGIYIALTFIGIPFVVRTVQPVLEDLDPSIEEAAAILGASRWRTFWSVTFPALRPAVVTGVALAFARAIGEYGSVIFIAGNMPMRTEIAPLLIVTKLEQYDYAGATAIATVMLVVSFASLLVINVAQNRMRKGDLSGSSRRSGEAPVLQDGPAARRLAIAGALCFLAVFLVMPLSFVFYSAFEHGATAYFAAVRDPDTAAAIRLTVATAAIAVPLNIVFGLAVAWLLSKYRFRGRNTLVTLIDLPFSVSPVIAGLAFVLLFGASGWFRPLTDALGVKVLFAFPAIVIATVFVTLPLVAREVHAVMESQGNDEEEAALTLGASGWQIFHRITLPKIKWALLYGVILCNARAMGEFGAVSVVSGHIRGETNTLTLHVEILYGEYAFSAAFAVSTLLALLAFLTLGAKQWVEWRHHNKPSLADAQEVSQ